MPRWTKEELDDYEKRRASKGGAGVGKPEQGKPLIEVLVPEPPAKTGKEDPLDDLNKTERAYYDHIINTMSFHALWVQQINLRLAKKTWYRPDFVMWTYRGEIRVMEVKGFMRDDAAVKVKMAAEIYRQFRFFVVTKKKLKDGGGWDYKAIEP